MTALVHEGAALATWNYRRLLWRQALLVVALALLLLLSVLGDLASGASGMGLGQLLHGLFDPATLSAAERVIIWNVRLPYSLMAVLVGAALALAGAEMQAILDNPLASPFTLGVSSSAALGASLAIAYPLGIAWLAPSAQVTVMAFVFACLSVLLLQAMSGLRGAGGGEPSAVRHCLGVQLQCAGLAAAAAGHRGRVAATGVLVPGQPGPG